MNMLELRNMPEVGYTLPTAAKIIGIHEKSIYRLVHQGQLDYYLDYTDRMMVTKEEVYRYMKKKMYAPKKSEV